MSHVIEGEGQFQILGRYPPVGEHCASVIDQHVNARLARGDRLPCPARLRHQGEIGQMHSDGRAPAPSFSSFISVGLGAALVAGDEDDAGAHLRQRKNRRLANSQKSPQSRPPSCLA